MTSRQQDSDGNDQNAADDQRPRLLTLEDQHKWEAKWASTLDAAAVARKRKSDDVEAARFARATDAIIIAFRQLRKLGHSRNSAGHDLVYGWNHHCAWTPTDLIKILHALGSDWRAEFQARAGRRARSA